MKARKIQGRIYWMGSVDWDRRLFDSLIPLPDGTSYNAYLIQGNEKTAFLDTVDPPRAEELMAQLEGSQGWTTSFPIMRNRTIPEPFRRFSKREVAPIFGQS